MIHVPVDMGSHDLIRFIGHYEDKIETVKIIRDQSMDQYMVLLQFKTQHDADRFYSSINGQQFNSLLEERCQLAYVGKVTKLILLSINNKKRLKCCTLPRVPECRCPN